MLLPFSPPGRRRAVRVAPASLDTLHRHARVHRHAGVLSWAAHCAAPTLHLRDAL